MNGRITREHNATSAGNYGLAQAKIYIKKYSQADKVHKIFCTFTENKLDGIAINTDCLTNLLVAINECDSQLGYVARKNYFDPTVPPADHSAQTAQCTHINEITVDEVPTSIC